MQISGLSSNFYLSDNPIYLTVSDISLNASYVQIILTRLKADGSTDIVSQPQNVYNLSTTASIDIAPLIKSFLPEPSHNTDYANLSSSPFYNNSIKAKITVNEFHITNVIREENGVSVITRLDKIKDVKSVTKTFLRGGKRTYNSNQNLVAGQNLIVTEKIPVWGGYPVDYYTTSAINGIDKSNVIPANLKEDRSVKGCDPYYIKFMNSLGGYSYWLFENWEDEEGGKNLGSVLRQDAILDLGSDFDSGITLISKVPKRFLALIKDLIISKEIYLYNTEDQSWKRITSDNNKIKEDPYSVNYKVKLKFNLYTRYNPALTW